MCIGLAACQLLFPTVAEQPPAEGGTDASSDCPSGEAGAWTPLSQGDDWTFYSFGFSSADYYGGTFDGRYLYLVPFGRPAERYDTHGSFTDPTSWTAFDTRKLGDAGGVDGGAMNHYAGAAFDGRYVYFVSNDDGYKTPATFVRYDTQASFQSTSSWVTFDATSELKLPPFMSFIGAVFDGRHVIFTPSFFSTALSYDTSQPFNAASSWEQFDVHDVSPKAAGLHGSVFDGTYVYMVPFAEYTVLDSGPSDGGRPGPPLEKATFDGTLLRYDTRKPFGSTSSWEDFDLASLPLPATGLAGGAFDGRYVYFSPNDTAGTAVRYDTKRPFGEKSSYEELQLTTLSQGAFAFWGAAFDGRFVYYIPQGPTTPSGLIARYDTTQAFGGACAWTFFDVSSLNTQAVGFQGAIFDGEFLYLVPASGTVVPRFRARTSRALPKLPGFYGSFL